MEVSLKMVNAALIWQCYTVCKLNV